MKVGNPVDLAPTVLSGWNACYLARTLSCAAGTRSRIAPARGIQKTKRPNVTQWHGNEFIQNGEQFH